MGTETLKDLINKATIIARNLEYGKSFETKTRSSSSTEPRARFTSSPSAEPRTRFTSSSSSGTAWTYPASLNASINRAMDSSGKFSIKLTEPEKEYISRAMAV
jgi:hypothetical protein